MNIFDGLDNTKMMNFEDLKRETFREIFSCRNLKAKSIKKAINYLNFSKEAADILTKNDRNPAYSVFESRIVKYERLRPAPYDAEANLILAKKRMKQSLDKQTNKHVVKNIKKCSILAKSQREKVKKAIELRNTGFFTTKSALNSSIDLTLQRKSGSMTALLSSVKKTDEHTDQLRKRRMQIRRNRQHSTIDGKLPGGEPLLAKDQVKDREPEPALVYLHRPTKSSHGMRSRPLNENLDDFNNR